MPQLTAADVLQLFAPSLIGDLLSISSFLSIQQIARHLPPVSGMGLELHLNAKTPRTDFSLRISKYDFEQRSIAAQGKAWLQSLAALPHPAWVKLARFYENWAKADHLSAQLIENFWLEFDLHEAVVEMPVPSLFFDLDRNKAYDQLQRIQLLDQLFLQFTGEGLGEARRTLLERSFFNKEDRPTLYYIGLLLSRATQAFRACISEVSMEELQAYIYGVNQRSLNEAEWAAFESWGSRADKLLVNFDVADQVRQKISLELFYEDPKEWERLFGELVDHDLCTREEADAILASAFVEAIEEEELLQLLQAQTGRTITTMRSNINHVKISYPEHGKPTAKVYLYLSYY